MQEQQTNYAPLASMATPVGAQPMAMPVGAQPMAMPAINVQVNVPNYAVVAQQPPAIPQVGPTPCAHPPPVQYHPHVLPPLLEPPAEQWPSPLAAPPPLPDRCQRRHLPWQPMAKAPWQPMAKAPRWPTG